MSLQINRTSFRGASAAQVAASFPNPYPNPDPTANGTLPVLPFPNSVHTTPVPSSPILAANSNTLINNFIYQYTNQIYGNGIVNIAYYAATQPRYVVHAGNNKNSSSWQTLLVNPGMRWPTTYQGTIKAPIPANAIPDLVGTDHSMLIWNLDPDPDTGLPMVWEIWHADIKGGTWECDTLVRAPSGGSITTGTNGASFSGVFPWAYEPTTGIFSGSGAAHLSECSSIITMADCLYGAINHALYFSIALTGSIVAPANTHDGSIDTHSIPEGTRFYFPPSVQMPSGLPLLGQMAFTAIQTYGFYISDTTGSAVTATAEHNQPWKNYQNTYYPASIMGSPTYNVLTNLPWTQLAVVTPMSDLAIVNGYTLPTAPTLATPTTGGASGSGMVTLSWTAPSSSGTSSITGYTVYSGTSSNGQGEKATDNVSGSSTLTDTLTLTSGTKYYFKVCASTTDPGSTGVNGASTGSIGAASNEVSFTAP